MWTNIFKIGGLHQISWFQFMPNESDLITLPDKSAKVELNDAATFLVLSSHLQLQKEGFLTTWTNSFVGPWDPSQGLHNPDEKIKLWLFLPGRHSSVVETAQAAVSKLRVVGSGLWISPGDSEEVAAALSQALRNCIERALIGLSYLRFGDVFTKYQYTQSEELFRRGQPTMEFIFAASEEAIFVHVIISAKHIRAISNGEIERVLKHSSHNSCLGLPVIVSPHGIRGRFTGCCASDVVKQICSSSGKSRTDGFVGLPHHVSQGGYQSRGQNCYVEVTLGCPKSVSEKPLQSNSNYTRNASMPHVTESLIGRGDLKGSAQHLSPHKKTFIYPSEAVLVLLLQTSFARSSLKRFWLQNWIGPSLPGSSFYMHCAGNIDYMEGLWTDTDKIRSLHGYDSSNNSNSSSIGSISSSSSDSDYKMTAGASELEADADSLSCRQSGLSSNDQLVNNGRKMGTKRPRMGMPDSLDQVGTDFTSTELNNSAITGVNNEQIASPWDWDDDDRGMDDIEDLLSHFGGFGDFFENDALPFGEPPGTAESQALMFSAPDYTDVGNSPVGVMDVSDQMLLPVGYPSFDSFNSAVPITTEEILSKNNEVTNNVLSSVTVNQTPVASTGEFDQITKAEALMTLAPEYGAVEAPTSEFSSSMFRSPYIPKSREPESSKSSTNSYIYGATPPSSPYFDRSDEKSGMSSNLKTSNVLHAKNYYTHVNNVKEEHVGKTAARKNSISTLDGMSPSPFSNLNAINAVKSAQRKLTEDTVEADCFFMSQKHALAMEVECLMFQASMCRVRHTLQSSGTSLVTGTNQLSSDPSTITDYITNEVKKKDNIPMRISGEVDGGMHDGHLNAPVGVWRPVGVSKVSKPTNSPSMELGSSLPHNSFHEEGVLSYGQRQPLQELLDAMPLLIQQATSFVDLALDADCGDGPYGWLGLQEQWRRGFSCGPSMVHAGCGGALASCHSLDIAGVELVDPLSVDVYSPSVMSLLQSDIKTALKSAFGTLDGPLSVIDWCKGRGQSGDSGSTGDGLSAESTVNESKDSSSTVMLTISEPISPSHSSASGSSSLKGSTTMDGSKVDETSQRRSNQEICSSGSDQHMSPRLRPTIIVLPSPAILVGYQDDWLKTSASSLQLWEKAPLEPYAVQKPISYCVICPDIDPLASAAADFFQQLGTVYETCKLGTHSPHNLGNQMDIDSGKWLSSGFVLLDCPQSMKIESSSASIVGSISDYLLSLSNGWDLTSYLRSLSKALKALKLSPSMSANPKEGSNGSCMVLYVICPFPDPMEVLQTVVESSVAVGSVMLQSDRDKRTILCSQVAKSLSCSAAVDESSSSNVLVLQGFSLPKFVLQVVTVDVIFRVSSPSLNERVILKETAFTVYNKARRILRGTTNDVVQSSSISSRSHSVLAPMSSSIPGMWKDCVGPRITGHSLPREGEIDGTLRPGTWDNSWQTRAGSLSCDPNRFGEYSVQDESCYMFEPLFILAEPGSLEHGISPINLATSGPESLKPLSDDNSGAFLQSANSAVGMDIGTNSQLDAPEMDGFGSNHQKVPSLHCCYGWTEDWRWLVCIWTDSRGELLDSHIFPFGGISSRQDTKGLECLFVQVLQQGCMILQACAPDTGVSKPRDFVIARIGTFYELEYLEWQKAINSLWGSEVKKWPLQLRRCMPDGMPSSNNGTSLQQQEMSLIHDRNLPSSPNPLYSPHAKTTGFMKAGIGQPAIRKQLMGGHAAVDNSRGLIQWVHSICFVTVSMDHSLRLLLQADSPSPAGNQGGNMGPSSYLEGFTPVKSLGSTSSSYILIPSPSLRFLPPNPLQLPTCLTADSPPLAHLLHSKGSAIPLSTGFVVSRAVPSMRKDSRSNMKEEWPSALSVSLIDYYGGNNVAQEKNVRGIVKQVGRSSSVESRDLEIETHLILESVIAELHALSWMTVSPAYLDRRTALPFHCDMVLRLRRILHFADKELSRRAEKSKH